MHTKSKVGPVLLTMSCVLFACAETGKKKTEQFSAEGCITGAVGGAILGALLAKDDKGKATMIGAVAGCLAGAIVGYEIGKRTEQYATQQQAVRSEIARNQRNLNELQQYNLQLAQNISDYERQIETIRSSKLDTAKKNQHLRDTKRIVSQQVAKATQALSSVDQELSIARQQYSSYEASATPVEVDDWKGKLAELEEEREILSAHVSSLNALSASI